MTEENSIVDKQLEDIQIGAKALFSPGQLVEVRVRTGKYWRGFYFTDHDLMAETVLKLDRDPRVQSVYYVFNQINPKLIELRKTCKCEKCTKGGLIVANPNVDQIEKILTGPTQHLTNNDEIEQLNWFFVDVDTIRSDKKYEHDSSTREEKSASREVARKVVAYLASLNWPSALLADSGNGFHLLQRIKLPNLDVNTAYISDCLQALAKKFNCAAAEIDNAVFNAARLTRAYGTTTRKGTETADRPFRRNKINKPKDVIGVVSFDQITNLADQSPITSKGKVGKKNMPSRHPAFDPYDFFRFFEEQNAFTITGTNTWQGHTVAVTDHCIISGTKHTGSILTGFIIGDTFGYKCFSDDCCDADIGDVLRKLADDGYDRYPNKIWVEELPSADFNIDITDIEQPIPEAGVNVDPPDPVEVEEEESEPTPVPASKPKPVPQTYVKAISIPDDDILDLPKVKLKADRQKLDDKDVNRFAKKILGIIFREPQPDIHDEYARYRTRFEKIYPKLQDIVGEVFGMLVQYEKAFKKLPSKVELISYINNDPSCMNYPRRDDMIDFIRGAKDNPDNVFETTVKGMFEQIDYTSEKFNLKLAFDKLNESRDIGAARSYLRDFWAQTIADSDFKPGTWQEETESIAESFRQNIENSDDSRKFKTGFAKIDNSGVNIGLDGERAIVAYGASNNRKSTLVLTLALNFAMQGKNGLILVGEHLRMHIMKRMTLMLSYHFRRNDDNPDGIDIIPPLYDWEGLNKEAGPQHLDAINKILAELRDMKVVPGLLEIQNMEAMIAGSKDPVGEVMSYIDGTHKRRQWDFVIIDPLDSVLPADKGEKNSNKFSQSITIVDRLFNYSRNFDGNRGLLVCVTAQFRAEARREIEKLQKKNSGPDNYDDEIVGLMQQSGNIQDIGNRLTQRFDFAIGVAVRTPDGNDGMLVQSRTRGGGKFDVMDFVIDAAANLMLEKTDGTAAHHVRPGQKATNVIEGTMHNYDEL